MLNICHFGKKNFKGGGKDKKGCTVFKSVLLNPIEQLRNIHFLISNN